ncbi:MAG TPA: hypothetical protein VGR96_02175, partial [Acidobacteriaceae bacterium]|nr:hypothetical protein [Acidobacteriaceae bacterium]
MSKLSALRFVSAVRLFCRLCPFAPVIGLLLWAHLFAAAAPTTPASPAGPPDVVVFTNGDRLTGRLVQVVAGKVTFHSDILGNVTAPWAKIRSLQSQQRFAVVEKDQRLTKKNAEGKVTLGSVAMENSHIRITPPQGAAKVFPTNDKEFLVDAATLHREIRDQSDPFYGWGGSVTLGASLVQGTTNNQTYTGAVTLLRTIPTVT